MPKNGVEFHLRQAYCTLREFRDVMQLIKALYKPKPKTSAAQGRPMR